MTVPSAPITTGITVTFMFIIIIIKRTCALDKLWRSVPLDIGSVIVNKFIFILITLDH